MKTLNILLIITILALFTPTVMGADSSTEKAVTDSKPQTLCPVMGGKINKSLYVDVKGKRIYVCCAGCIDQIKAHPDKYLKIMKADGVVPEDAPKTKKNKDSHAGHNH